VEDIQQYYCLNIIYIVYDSINLFFQSFLILITEKLILDRLLHAYQVLHFNPINNLNFVSKLTFSLIYSTRPKIRNALVPEEDLIFS